jgi:hypothetical protein
MNNFLTLKDNQFKLIFSLLTEVYKEIGINRILLIKDQISKIVEFTKYLNL